jgi:hypothetical protein
VIALGGTVIIDRAAPVSAVFWLSAAAMATMGLGTALFVKMSRWR